VTYDASDFFDLSTLPCSFQMQRNEIEESSVFLEFENVGGGEENLISMISARVVEESI
jgi:hypothetical protein